MLNFRGVRSVSTFRFSGWIQGLESSSESIATLPTALGLGGATAARRGTVAYRGGSQARHGEPWVGGEGLGGNARHFLVMCFFVAKKFLNKSNETVFDIKDITDVNQVSHVFFVEFILGSFVHSDTQSIHEKSNLRCGMLEINQWEDFVHQMRLPSRELTYDKFSKVVADFSRIRGPKIIGWMLIFNLL